MSSRIVLGVCMVLLCASGARAEDAGTGVLALEDYLGQVRAQGPDYSRAVADYEINAINRILVGKHWSTNNSFNVSRSENANSYPLWNPYYPYDESQHKYWDEAGDMGANLWYTNQWDLGLSSTLNYNLDRHWGWTENDFYVPSVQATTGDEYNVNLTLNLWQNFLGASLRAGDRRDFANSDSSLLDWDYNVQTALQSAKLAYFNLSYDRALLEGYRDELARDQRLAAWAEAKGTALDKLQAQTAVENVEQSIEHEEDQERLDRDALNRLRGKAGSVVDESLETPDGLLAAAPVSWPAHEPQRLDLRGAQAALVAEKNQLTVSEEGVKLPFNLNGSFDGNLAANGPDYVYTVDGYNPPDMLQYNAYFSLSVPFEYFTKYWDVNLRSTKVQLTQQEKDVQETANSLAQQWEDLSIRYGKSRERIRQAADLETLSQMKAEMGEAQAKRGKLDLFEALSFQGAYFSARVARLQWVEAHLQILASADVYKAEAGQR